MSRGEVFALDGYALNEDYERVEDVWTFNIWYAGRRLVEQKFTTYRPTNPQPGPP
ncbi:MAG: hypothetical protein ACYC18_04500 [Gammaproteobacteria bacterium]